MIRRTPRRLGLAVPIMMLSLSCASTPAAKPEACPYCEEIRPAGSASPHSLYLLDAIWQTDEGATIKLSQFRGEPVVIAMFFATCEGTCILTVEHLREIEASLPSDTRRDVRFVLVTFDPTHDSAPVLNAYRKNDNLSPKRWALLRGTTAATRQLAARLGIAYSISPQGRIVHSNQITILDREGRVVSQQIGNHPDTSAAVHAVAEVDAR